MLSNMARTGVIGFAKTLASELAPDNILINNVCPGVIFTDRIKQLATVRAEEAGITYEDALANMTQDIPLGRIGDPKEFANLVVFLASDRASYITGTTIQVDGGMAKGAVIIEKTGTTGEWRYRPPSPNPVGYHPSLQ